MTASPQTPTPTAPIVPQARPGLFSDAEARGWLRGHIPGYCRCLQAQAADMNAEEVQGYVVYLRSLQDQAVQDGGFPLPLTPEKWRLGVKMTPATDPTLSPEGIGRDSHA